MSIVKTNALISCPVTAQLICAFVFAFAKSRFSHDAAEIPKYPINHFCCIQSKIQAERLNQSLFCLKDDDRMAISEEPGQE